MGHPHVIVDNGDGTRTLSIYTPEKPIVVAGDHPQYDRLLFEAKAGDLSYDQLMRYVLEAESDEHVEQDPASEYQTVQMPQQP